MRLQKNSKNHIETIELTNNNTLTIWCKYFSSYYNSIENKEIKKIMKNKIENIENEKKYLITKLEIDLNYDDSPTPSKREDENGFLLP